MPSRRHQHHASHYGIEHPCGIPLIPVIRMPPFYVHCKGIIRGQMVAWKREP